MKLATLKDGGPDGVLIVVSDDNQRYQSAASVAATLQAALEDWEAAAPRLAALAKTASEPLGGVRLAAPLPRAWQWLDGSAFASHGELMSTAFGLPPVETDPPLMYQGLSHQFLGPNDDVALPSEDDGIDFEGEFGVITDEVPMGVRAEEALKHIKLLVQINDWSLRTLAPREMKTGFGWIWAKPACSLAPFAITPDGLGATWRDGRVCLDLCVHWNDKPFGRANGGAMSVGFHELIAHAARTRVLPAGTLIGSGTVSNDNYRDVGSSCIAERRGLEIVDFGHPKTPFMRFGERVRMEALLPGQSAPFGVLDQRVIEHRATA
jgi:fumarylacetoacetate (FAA) hydrolase